MTPRREAKNDRALRENMRSAAPRSVNVCKTRLFGTVSTRKTTFSPRPHTRAKKKSLLQSCCSFRTDTVKCQILGELLISFPVYCGVQFWATRSPIRFHKSRIKFARPPRREVAAGGKPSDARKFFLLRTNWH